ncbi:U32 family peptidase [Geobacter sp. AOG1]|uniref:peptidase U32 family protein n=1 Tax=Geobacter sp. AOG1 TaxID=1566346 RepID=UPI001CC4F058|nr:U32 family peptidase [Geobacter sp. AOG1]GFE57661.1 peptidase U32 [Geobacter sp. AOG1]
MTKPELLAPAGNMEKLKIAIHYGADAVYLGGKAYGLRNHADNFTLDELAGAVAYAHHHRVKVYLTVNAYPDNADIDGLYRYLESLRDIPLDACIAADPGVVAMLREVAPDRPIHLSTQANTTNWKSALFWQEQGISRINLAREMSLDDLRYVRERVGLELEAFVHGAMCISYSGRCLLSSAMSSRPANKGECAHPCRWSYALVEETRPGQYFPVIEDETGTFIFNSKDLCLLQYIPELVESGINSLKIEGRMKGIHYVAAVVRVYREALDRYCDDPENYRCRPEWLDELCKISHRGYTTGFFLGPPKDLDHEYRSRYTRSHDFVGIVEEVKRDGSLGIEARNRIEPGDELEFIGRGMTGGRHRLTELWSSDGTPLQVAHPNQRITLRVPFPAEKYDLIRREKPVEELT